jgi:hypothetical protein
LCARSPGPLCQLLDTEPLYYIAYTEAAER